jgi:large subunit ribosomal protein L23
MPFLNKLFGKNKETAKPKKTVPAAKEEKRAAAEVKKTEAPKTTVFKADGILISSHTAEKALMAQKDNQYVFKVSAKANKVMIAAAVKKTYGVKVKAVNIINIPRKARRVGRTMGFKAGYKKAVITLAKGQSIEIAK